MSGSIKCGHCGLVNFADQHRCRRCGELLDPIRPSRRYPRSLGGSLLLILATTVVLLIACWISLLATSEGLDDDQQRAVGRAIRILEQEGFSNQAFILGRLTRFRATDNWWNQYVGHQNAYAATNFPFGVVTLYPPFFRIAVDDVERAAILLHESYHLMGSGEETALRTVWLQKARLGWTAAAYGQTRAWRNTREWTSGTIPGLFQCGDDRRSDCFE